MCKCHRLSCPEEGVTLARLVTQSRRICEFAVSATEILGQIRRSLINRLPNHIVIGWEKRANREIPAVN